MKSTYSRVAVAGVGLALAVAMTPVVFAEDAPPATAEALDVMSWNICGEAGGKRGEAGYCPYRDQPQVKVDQIVELADSGDLDVILLQEVCAETADSHLGLLETALGDEWQFGHAKGARPDGRTDCRGDLNGELGVGIAVRAAAAQFTAENTLPPDPTGENQATLPTLCADVDGWTSRVCTTHLLADPEDPRRGQQVENVRDFVWDNRQDLVLGGDFNLFPGSDLLAPIADNFDECDGRAYGDDDEVDENTHHAWNSGEHRFTKRDHIFTSPVDAGTRFTACDAMTELMDDTENEPDSGPPSGYSDHAPILGTVAVG